METEKARKRLAKYCVLHEALQVLVNDDDYKQTVQNRPIPSELLKSPRPTANRNNGIPETYQNFLNALAEACSFRIGSDMVTAIIIEEKPSAEYVFHVTRNSLAPGLRGDEDREGLLDFLRQILGQIHDIQEKDERVFLKSEAHKQLFCTVIGDNIDKINYYRKQLDKTIKEFMNKCKKSIMAENLNETLESVLHDIEASKRKSGTDRQEYRRLIWNCGTLIGHQPAFPKGLIGADMKIRDCWDAIFHFAGRLQSYRICIRAFFLARIEYDELFSNPTVNFVSPKTARKVSVDWTLEDLTTYFNRSDFRKGLWSSEDIKKIYGEIQRLSSESREGTEVGFHRIVHAEVALAHWFYSERPGSDPSKPLSIGRLSGGYRYVATSKPCCLMCHEFFNLYIADVVCRPFHTRIYTRWTLPDFEDCCTEGARQELMAMYGSMTHKVKQKCSNVLAIWKPELPPTSFDEEEHFVYEDFRKRTSLEDATM